VSGAVVAASFVFVIFCRIEVDATVASTGNMLIHVAYKTSGFGTHNLQSRQALAFELP
jgi:hypothetical protein